MDFEFTAEEEQLRATVARFLAAQAPTAYVRTMLDHPVGTTPDVWQGLAEMGVVGLLAPGAAGMTTMGVVLEEMGRAVHPGPFLSSAVGAVSAVAAADPSSSLLAELATGSAIGTLVLASHDVADALAADVLLTFADDRLYAAERDAPGVVVTPTPTPDGTRKLARVQLGDAPRRLIGNVDPGPVLDRLRIAHVVDGVGAASAALAMAVEYAKERHQFGVPIGSFQAVQHLCADMLQALELGRAGAYYALWAADHADPPEVHRAATMAKAWASDAFSRIGADAIQVFGGVGYTWEHDIHLFYKRLLSLEHVHGGSADHLAELASIVVDDQR